MNNAIAATAVRTLTGPAKRESTSMEFQARKLTMPIQDIVTGQISRMFTVMTLPKPVGPKLPAITGTLSTDPG